MQLFRFLHITYHISFERTIWPSTFTNFRLTFESFTFSGKQFLFKIGLLLRGQETVLFIWWDFPYKRFFLSARKYGILEWLSAVMFSLNANTPKIRMAEALTALETTLTHAKLTFFLSLDAWHVWQDCLTVRKSMYADIFGITHRVIAHICY